jgi:hypothetical protein
VYTTLLDDAGLVAQPITIEASASPFTQITVGQVRAMVPDGWDAVPAADVDDAARVPGLAAPGGLARMDGSIAGMSATWSTPRRSGVPSRLLLPGRERPVLSR